jgi:hypothetical protein
MTDSEIISRIIELETPIVHRIISDKKFRPSDKDEYQKNREELKVLREKVKHSIYPKSSLSGGNPQVPNYEELEDWKLKIFNTKENN